METPGRGTVSCLWLLFLDTRTGETTGTEILCFMHQDLYPRAGRSMKPHEYDTVRSRISEIYRERSSSHTLSGNLGSDHEGAFHRDTANPRVTHGRSGSGLQVLKGRAVVMVRSKAKYEQSNKQVLLIPNTPTLNFCSVNMGSCNSYLLTA